MTTTDFSRAVATMRLRCGSVRRHAGAVFTLVATCFCGTAEAVAQDHAASAWQVEVELAPSDGEARGPWHPRTILLQSETISVLPRAADTSGVTWLDGLQRQASHLGMGTAATAREAGMTGGGDLVSSLGRGVSGLAKAWTGSEAVPGGASQASPRERMRTVSVLPGAERRREAASSARCTEATCYGRRLIGWEPSLAACTKDVRIGVIDTSFDLSHPAFKRLRVVRKEFVDGARPSEEDWHGTAILSLLAGDPESGTPGLVPDATFLLATAFRGDPAGNGSTNTELLLEALSWLDQLDVDVVNMSFAGPPDPAIAKMIEHMSLKGVLFASAAGNMGPTAPPSYPGALPHVIAVTAVDRNGDVYRNANRGSYIDVAAPGVDVMAALPGGKQGLQTGTSFAVPFVTAILATRAASGMVEGTEDLLLEQISRRDLGVPGRDPVYGLGLALAPTQCPGGLLAQSQQGSGAKKTRKPAKQAGAAAFRW